MMSGGRWWEGDSGCRTTLQNGFDVFSENEKLLCFLINTTKWFYKIFLDLARDWVWLYKMALVLFKKQRIHLQNGL